MRQSGLLCLLFLSLLIGLNGLEHIAGLGNMGKVDFGRNALGRALRMCTALAGRVC
jgi:hypothetical protein